jgi:carbon monoxide dehydrogenase subunit G
MELQGSQLIAQTQVKIWEALNDPDILKACINGCESIEVISDTEYKAVVMAAIGPVKARFTAKLTLHDVVPPTSYSMAFQGNGGAAGFGKGHVSVTLAPEGKETCLSYVASVQVGGKLAQIGSRLIDGVGRKLAEDFFAAFKEKVGEPSQTDGPTGDAPENGVAEAEDRGQKRASQPGQTRARRPMLSLRNGWLWGAVVVLIVGAVVLHH